MGRWLLFLALCFCFETVLQAQSRLFTDIEIRVDTTLYTSQESRITISGRPIMAFPVQQPDQIVDLYFYPPVKRSFPAVSVVASREIVLLDSMELVDSLFYRTRVQFADISKAGIIPLSLRIQSNPLGPSRTQLYELYPYQPTRAILQTKDDEVFLGEEKVFNVTSVNLPNIIADGIWQTQNGIEFRLFKRDNQLKLSLVTNDAGTKELTIPVPLLRPILQNKQLISQLPPLAVRVVAKASRTAFLGLDKKEITLDFDAPRGIEVQIDRSRLLQLKKTYRIETTAEPGGAFVGELFTRSSLSNDKILAWIRPYALHRPSDGYLYIKDGDELKFITNVAISEKTRISKITLRHPGGDFGDNLTVSPGEQVDVRIEGTGLEKVGFLFEGGQNAVRDSSLATENVSVYSLRVPVTIAVRKVVIYRGKEPTGYELPVREFQAPRQLDFLTLNWGDGEMEVGKLSKPILYDKTIQGLALTFAPQKIDAGGKIYGKQYLVADINIFNARKDLIETRHIENIVICPGENSPRAGFYDGSDCLNAPMNLNQFLAHKTFDLPDWATIEVNIRHNPFKYNGAQGFSQKIELILQKHVTFDVDVSLPAGLLSIQPNADKPTSFGGVSIAVIPQLSFYKPDKINKLRPYRIGVGFIALNAFDFSSSTEPNRRDIGLVVLASVFPTKTGSRFSFPLYVGGGYKFIAKAMFFLVGPGIQVSF